MSRVTELFAARLARRRGETRPDEADALAELDSYGESLGVMPGVPANAPTNQPAMPGEPMTSAEESQPAGDALASMAPPGGAETQVATLGNTGTAPASKPMGSGIPALDEMAQRPMRKTRGLLHSRRMGRVMPPGG